MIYVLNYIIFKKKKNRVDSEYKDFAKLKKNYQYVIENTKIDEKNIKHYDEIINKQCNELCQLQSQLNENMATISVNDSNIDAIATEISKISDDANKFEKIITELIKKGNDFSKILFNNKKIEEDYNTLNQEYLRLDFEYQDILNKYIEITEKYNKLERYNISDNPDIKLLQYENEKLKKKNKDIEKKFIDSEEENRKIISNNNCIICQSVTKNIILLPCRHFVMCHSCEIRNRQVNRNRKCPTCRSNYTETIKVF